MTTKKQVVIDFSQILDVAMKGVRRTAVFMGLGLNAASDPALTKFSLEGRSYMQLVPEPQPPETVAHFKTEFGKWIVGCGLRELLETFETFLTEVFDACMVSAIKAGLVTQAEAEKERKRFGFGGLSNKVTVLGKLGVTGVHSHYFASLYEARNCLTHRQGLVGWEDCKDAAVPGRLVLTWRGYAREIREPSGNIIPLEDERGVPCGLPVYLPDGGDMLVRVLERRREFAVGDVVELSPADLAEICAFVIHEAQAILASAVAYVEGPCGIPVQRPEEPETMPAEATSP